MLDQKGAGISDSIRSEVSGQATGSASAMRRQGPFVPYKIVKVEKVELHLK